MSTAVVTEVLYVRVPLSLKVAAEALAAEHGTSMAKVVARALEVYLAANGAELESIGFGRLP